MFLVGGEFKFLRFFYAYSDYLGIFDENYFIL